MKRRRKPAAVELRRRALIGGVQRIVLGTRCSGAHDTQRALGTVSAGARLIGASAFLKARFRRRARGDRPDA